MPRITIKTEALTVNEIEHFLRTFCDRVVAGEQELSDLDSATGDADHGANLSRGMRAVTAMLDEGSKYRTPGTLLKAAAQGIVDRGRARLGDKTMYDAIKPASDAFAEQCQAGGGLSQALQAAALAAEAGARATRNMRARRGKSSYVGDNSIGTVDPGAESMAWLIRCLADATKLAKS
jgi:dihydroxyacetone kinase-like protein